MSTASLHSWPVRLSLVTAVAVGAGALTLLPGGSPPAAAAGLVPWDSCDDLVAHYRDQLAQGVTPYGVGASGDFMTLESDAVAATSGEARTAVSAPMPAAAAGGMAADESATGALGAVGNGPTGTNLQERGVDEPDTVKAVGDLLLVAAGGRLQVLLAGTEPELLSSVALGDATAGPAELLVDGDRVLALVSGWRPVEPPVEEPLPVDPLPVDPMPVDPLPPAPFPGEPPTAEPLPDGPAVSGPAPISQPRGAVMPSASLSIMPAAGTGFVTAVLVDLADPSAPEVLETLELDGRYVSARLVDGSVRLVTSSSPQVPVAIATEPWSPAQEQAALERNEAAVDGLTAEQVLPAAVRRDAAGTVQDSGSAVDCADVQHASTGPTGSSTLLVTTLRPSQGLAALDSTAVTTAGDVVYASTDRLYVATSQWGGGPAVGRMVPGGEITTELHAFDTTASDTTRYLGSGSVRGTILGRWALSEHDGHLRVATTLQGFDTGGPSSSSVAVLAERDGGLVEVGRVDGLGPDEQIYAVRYFGDLATVVTFRQTDPLYVLDLAEPSAPRLVGELEIPGFSTYLHPVGDDRLLGVGQDADSSGRVTGFQLSLFDLSDLSAPVQVDRLSLGQGWSPASDDSRAFSYDPERQLALLPFSDDRGQGSALGVRVDGTDLVEDGRLSVGLDMVERTVLVDGAVLAVTPGSVVAGDVDTWERTGVAALTG